MVGYMFDVKTALFACLLTMSACESDSLNEEPGFDDKADTGSWDIVDISVGDTLTGFSIEKLQTPVANASQADLERSIVLLKLHLLAGQSATVLMRAESTEVDPYLIVKDTDKGLTIGQNDDQAVVASLGLRDALVSVQAATEQDVLIFASGGANLHTGGQFAVSVVAHNSPGVDLHNSSPTSEIHFGSLRDSEVEIGNWIASGFLSEGNDGMLFENSDALSALSIRERVDIGRAVDRTNERRLLLVDSIVSRSNNDSASRESVGQAIGAIYRRTR